MGDSFAWALLAGSELPRISLPRTRVNRASLDAPGPSGWHDAYGEEERDQKRDIRDRHGRLPYGPGRRIGGVVAVAERRAEIVWEGDLPRGGGKFTVGSGAMEEMPVTWASRTERSDGKTSPEELIAAAHGACFAMALSNVLAEGGTPPERLEISEIGRASGRERV